MNYEVINGDNINKLKNYPDNYFDSVVTDPPYGLGKEPNADELMKDWIEHGYHEIEGKGFMGKEWDAFVPQPIFWQEVFRVLKPGGHVLAFYGTRTYDWGVMAMRFAGFEVRDCIQWLYGSGFPKSHNISKALDKIGNNNQEWDGWGTALKPANEPIVLARKPLEKGLSIAENILKWGVGGINIDASRIETSDDLNGGTYRGSNNLVKTAETFFIDSSKTKGKYEQPIGRFPANIILTHHEDCVCKGTKKVKAIKGGVGERSKISNGNINWKPSNTGSKGDEDGNETIENWECHEDCPIRILDEQSGISKSVVRKPNGKPILNVEKGWNNNSMVDETIRGINDKGGASRFFYVAKASKSERNKGLDDFEEKPLAFSNQAKAELKRGNENFDGGDAKGHGNSIRHIKNFHPTVKPIKLMQYLVKMITPPNGLVLDPFCGSGTTGVACKLDGFQFVGLEQDPEYAKIAEARIKNTQIEKKQLEIF